MDSNGHRMVVVLHLSLLCHAMATHCAYLQNYHHAISACLLAPCLPMLTWLPHARHLSAIRMCHGHYQPAPSTCMTSCPVLTLHVTTCHGLCRYLPAFHKHLLPPIMPHMPPHLPLLTPYLPCSHAYLLSRSLPPLFFGPSFWHTCPPPLTPSRRVLPLCHSPPPCRLSSLPLCAVNGRAAGADYAHSLLSLAAVTATLFSILPRRISPAPTL